MVSKKSTRLFEVAFLTDVSEQVHVFTFFGVPVLNG